VLNLGTLAVFKYADFFINSLVERIPGLPLSPLELVLPIGISFYTFQSMSYTIDIYRREIEPTPRFVDFACYVSMFPQLVAGPIVRYRALASQLAERLPSLDRAASGMRRFLLGLVKKVLLADSVATLLLDRTALAATLARDAIRAARQARP